MSVLIKGMEMPTSCDDCEFCKRAINGYDWCCVPMTNGRSKPLDEPVLKPDWCPLVPIPPHGALIDRDDFLAECSELVNGYKAITDDFVVIPAEEAAQREERQDETPAGPYDLLYEEGGPDA